jgi:AraC-like DNA-binding protein
MLGFQGTPFKPLLVENKEVQIISLINKNYRDRPSNSFYSREMQISSTKLSGISNRIFGKSIQSIQNEKVIAEATQLLSFTNKTIAEIGYCFNFSSPAHFSTFFKRHTEKTPSSFR